MSTYVVGLLVLMAFLGALYFFLFSDASAKEDRKQGVNATAQNPKQRADTTTQDLKQRVDATKQELKQRVDAVQSNNGQTTSSSTSQTTATYRPVGHQQEQAIPARNESLPTSFQPTGALRGDAADIAARVLNAPSTGTSTGGAAPRGKAAPGGQFQYQDQIPSKLNNAGFAK